jgi:hypothetical protein
MGCFFLFALTLSGTGFDQEDITVINNVFLAFGHDLSGSLHGSLVSVLLESVIVENNSLNECFLKICRKISA